MKNVIKISILTIMVVAFVLLLIGNKPTDADQSGFLSDYSRLQKQSSNSMQYINTEELSRYSKFIVDPVKVIFPETSKASKLESEGTLTKEVISDLANYMHDRIALAVEEAGSEVVYHPEVGVARVRLAITDLEASKGRSYMPSAKILGAGVGGASLEAEILDSMTKQQFGAIIDSRRGSMIPFDGMGNWDAAKQAMDQWGERFQKRLEDAQR